MREFAAREIGARIAQCRRESGGMTQEELAETLNVSKRSVQDYEAGVTIPYKHFARLEQVFGRSLSWFLHGENEPAEAVEEMHALREEVQQLRQLIEERLPPGEAEQPGDGRT